MFPSFQSKDQRRNHSEEGYHSLSSSQWTPSQTTPMVDLNNGISNRTMSPSNLHFQGHSSLGRPITPRDDLSPLDNTFLNSQNNGSSLFDGRGILIERIKVAQNTIDSLSTKVFFYENERATLKEQKEQFEKGYYNLIQENSNLLNDKISKDTLLKKINTMGEDVTNLLKTQETLLEKHKDQQKHIDYYKSQLKIYEEENEDLKKANEEMQTVLSRDAALSEKLKTSEEDLKNQSIVLKIEKETLASELERVVNKLKIQDERVRERKEREQDLLKENALYRQECRAKDREVKNAEEKLEYLQKQITIILEEKNEGIREAESEMVAAYEDVKRLQNTISACQHKLLSETEKVAELKTRIELKNEEYSQLKEKLNEADTVKKSHLAMVKNLEKQIADYSNENSTLQRENSGFKLKLKSAKQDITNLNETLKSEETKRNNAIQESDQQIKELQNEIQTMRVNSDMEKDLLKQQQQAKILEIEHSRKVAEENACKLQVELESAQAHWSTLNNDFVSYKKEQETCLSFKRREIQELQDTNKKLTEQIQNSDLQIQKVTAQVEDLSKQLQSTQQENNDLHFEYQEKSKVIEKHTQTIVELENECVMLRQKNLENLELIDMLNKQSKSETLTQKALYESKLNVLEGDYETVKIALRNAEQEKSLCIETYKRQITSLQKQSDLEVEKLSQERDEINTTLQAAYLDVEEYKLKFKGVEKELEGVSNMNTDLKQNLSLLSKELDSYQQESQYVVEKDQEICDLQNIIKNLRARELALSTEVSKKDTDLFHIKKQSEIAAEEIRSLKADMSNKESEYEGKRKELTDNIEILNKTQKEFQMKNEKLKVECRRRAMQNHTTCGEMEMLKSEIANFKKELEVVVELNRKLEMVNETLQEENTDLKRKGDHLQNDMGVLKTSYEELLAKELTKQKSEFIMKENQLLKRISNDRVMRPTTPVSSMIS